MKGNFEKHHRNYVASINPNETIDDIVNDYRDHEKLRAWAKEFFHAGFNEHDDDELIKRMLDELEERLSNIGCYISDIDKSDMDDVKSGIVYTIRTFIRLDRESNERRVCFYDADGFGSECPGNWGELACYMEELAEEMGYDVEDSDDDAEAFWNFFWSEYHSPNHGKLVNVPELTERDPLDGDWKQ